MAVLEIDQKILEKIKDLPEEYSEEVLDFVEFLSDKSRKNRERLDESLKDLREGEVIKIESEEDIKKHISSLSI